MVSLGMRLWPCSPHPSLFAHMKESTSGIPGAPSRISDLSGYGTPPLPQTCRQAHRHHREAYLNCPSEALLGDLNGTECDLRRWITRACGPCTLCGGMATSASCLLDPEDHTSTLTNLLIGSIPDGISTCLPHLQPPRSNQLSLHRHLWETKS